MKILSINKKPVLQIPNLNVDRKGRRVRQALAVQPGVMDKIPSDIKLLFCASDLQGFDASTHRGGSRLMGYAVAEALEQLAIRRNLAPGRDVGVILAGDLFALPNRRGGFGDTTDVWKYFAQRFRWVIGVLGNHDSLAGTNEHIDKIETLEQPNLSILHTGTVEQGGMKFCGISGCQQDSDRPWRFSAEEYEELLHDTFHQQMDCLILHDGPDIPGTKFRGQETIRHFLIEQTQPKLVIRGHKAWPGYFYRNLGDKQILNCEEHAYLFQERV